MPLPHITTVSFDGDATLWDFEKVMRLSLRYARDELRRLVANDRVEQLTIDEMIRIRDAAADELEGDGMSLSAIRLEAFRRTLVHVGIEDEALAERLNAVYREHRFADIELYADVVPALDTLGRHFEMGLLSNGNTPPDRCGLGGRFSFVIFSQDYGVDKPAPRIFEIALKEAGCPTEQLVHVGDSLETDVQGAKNAGILSVWLNRDGVENQTDVIPDFEIQALTELASILLGNGDTP